MDWVDKGLSVVGFNNTVTYKQGDPTVNDTGLGTTFDCALTTFSISVSISVDTQQGRT